MLKSGTRWARTFEDWPGSADLANKKSATGRIESVV
jgi:hypothetical protein